MTEPTTPTLLVLGAGPKALAVAAKAKVMADLGLPAPRVVVVDAHAVAANWQPIGGWTDGRHRLGTSPEKDVGFPYRGAVHRGTETDVNRGMLAYSWMSFLVEHQTYTEWVDRGRPHPQHNVWARYLAWVAERAELDLRVGRVTEIAADDDTWSLRLADGTEVVGDQLMITGPGSSASAFLDDDRVLSVSRFWDLVPTRDLPASSRAAVVGGGETAGSVLDELVRHDIMTISAIAPGATIYTRGESYFENAMFSDPTGWPSMAAAERRDLIRRTDRGVFSVRVQESLLSDHRVHHLQGRVTAARRVDDLVELTLTNDGRSASTQAFDLVIDATGGQPLWFTDLMTPDTLDLIELALGPAASASGPTLTALEESIDARLAVGPLTPTLFLPNLAGFAQGPGFPNLSCLGELSNRVVRGSLESAGTLDRPRAGVVRR